MYISLLIVLNSQNIFLKNKVLISTLQYMIHRNIFQIHIFMTSICLSSIFKHISFSFLDTLVTLMSLRENNRQERILERMDLYWQWSDELKYVMARKQGRGFTSHGVAGYIGCTVTSRLYTVNQYGLQTHTGVGLYILSPNFHHNAANRGTKYSNTGGHSDSNCSAVLFSQTTKLIIFLSF